MPPLKLSYVFGYSDFNSVCVIESYGEGGWGYLPGMEKIYPNSILIINRIRTQMFYQAPLNSSVKCQSIRESEAKKNVKALISQYMQFLA